MPRYIDAERKYLAISIKHTEYRWKFGNPCVLWGRRTKDDEKRSFAGYTQLPDEAEIYSLDDWRKSGYWNNAAMKLDEPVHMEPKFCRKWRDYDTVLIDYEEYCGYCHAASLPLSRPKPPIWKGGSDIATVKVEINEDDARDLVERMIKDGEDDA